MRGAGSGSGSGSSLWKVRAAIHEIHSERGHESRHTNGRLRLRRARIDLTKCVGALREVAHQATRLFGEMARPAKHVGHELAL